MEIKAGMVVKSIAGHDSDRFYLVFSVENNLAYIADGKVRKVEKLKAKNFKHVRRTNHVVNLEDYRTNKSVRDLLHKFNYE